MTNTKVSTNSKEFEFYQNYATFVIPKLEKLEFNTENLLTATLPGTNTNKNTAATCAFQITIIMRKKKNTGQNGAKKFLNIPMNVTNQVAI